MKRSRCPQTILEWQMDTVKRPKASSLWFYEGKKNINLLF